MVVRRLSRPGVSRVASVSQSKPRHLCRGSFPFKLLFLGTFGVRLQNGGTWGGSHRHSVESFPSQMRRAFRLKSRLDFQAVYTKGKSVANKAAVLYVQSQRPAGVSRVGFAAGKKLGKAVVRNRIKRRIKEGVRLLWHRMKPGYYVIVIARQGAKDMPFPQLQARLIELFERAGVLRMEG